MSQKLSSVTDATVDWAQQRGLNYIFTAQTGSTNDDAKVNALDDQSDFLLHLTNHQQKGRGRGDKTWLDTGNGESLLSTWSFKVSSPPQAITGPRIGLALFSAASKTWPSLPWGLKPPNDLILKGHKVAGLLIESISAGDSHRLVIGLGFNVLNHPRKFDEASHLSESLLSGIDFGEWFQFLDELSSQLQSAIVDCMKTELSSTACLELARAINATPERPFQVTEVTPQGDLIHNGGIRPWMDI